MEKFKIKLRDAKKLDPIAFGYCRIQNLLKNRKPFAYYSNVDGWRFDLYEINGVYISTGYAPIGQDLSKDAAEKIKALEIAAKNLYSSFPNYEEREMKRNELLEKACALMVQD